ncbi:MAG: hypothetical protein HYZ34_05915 [Ignavibacteriae bacterium]|nr:hypothetical protein [Ignavibacteriota bacterium]
MGTEIKSELKIPDLWYDFYARIIPGTAFTACVRVGILGYVNTPSFEEMVILVAIGYFVALLTQPISSRITKIIEDVMLTLAKRPKEFFRTVQKSLGNSSRQVLILSKMHSEATFFIQLSNLSLVYLALEKLHGAPRISTGYGTVIATLIFALFAFEVTGRRIRRANDYDKVYEIT